jgi:Zn-dependent protease
VQTYRISSLQVAKVKGIPIKLHFTLLIVFALIAWTLAVGFMPPLYPNLPKAAYWIMGVIGAAVLFASVLLHELSHSLLSKKYGLRVRQIVLFVFGGVSDIREESKDYKKEFAIAIVGPLSSFALAGLFAAIWFALAMANVTGLPQENTLFYFPTSPQGQQQAQPAVASSSSQPVVAVTIAEGILRYGAIVNILLGLFNLIPAFPLDGGRVLRAALVRWKKSHEEATRTAVKVGIGISYVIIAFGFITVFTGSFIGGIWLILIGWFLQSGAQSYLQNQEITSALSGIRLHDIMNTRFVAVTPDTTVRDAIDNYFNVYRKSELPVVEKDSSTGDNYYYLVGAVTANRVVGVPDENREKVKVADIMMGKRELIIMRPSDTADQALRRMMQNNKGRVFVCENLSSFATEDEKEAVAYEYDAGGKRYDRLIGIISKTDILNIAKERMEYAETFDKSAKGALQKEHRHYSFGGSSMRAQRQ